MAIPELDLARARRWVQQHNDVVPPDARDEIRYELDADGRALTIFECRPPWDGVGTDWTRFPVARFRYTRSRTEWALYWRDRNSDFHLFPEVPPGPDLARLLEAVDSDPTGIFWG